MTQQYDSLNAYLTKVLKVFSAEVRVAILIVVANKVGARIEENIPAYPEPGDNQLPLFYTRHRESGVLSKGTQLNSTYQSKFKSLKQQRLVFALIAKGKIPYRRTGTLGKSITSEVIHISPVRATISVGTAMPYSPFVIGDRQTFIHAKTWEKLENSVSSDESFSRIESTVRSTLVLEVRKYL